MIQVFGGKISDNEPVIDIQSADGIVEVTTKKGKYKARSLIITAGAWAPKLLKQIGLDLPLWVSMLNILRIGIISEINIHNDLFFI